MALAWEQVIIDSSEPRQLGTWWANALQWVVLDDQDVEFEIRPGPDVVPGLPFVRVAEPKVQENRLHIDLRPDNQGRGLPA